MKRIFASAVSVLTSIAVLSTSAMAQPPGEGGNGFRHGNEAFAELSVTRQTGSVLPESDQGNTKNWILDESLSDEFDGSQLDMEKWQPIPYTWAGAWRWQDDNVSVSDSNLHLTARHDKNDLLDESPNGWSSHNMYDGDSVNGEYVTSLYGSRSGKSALVYGNFFPIWVRTDTVIRNLDPDKTYSFTAYIKKTGNQPITQMYATDPGDNAVNMAGKTIDIEESDDFTEYTISDISPSADGTCKIGFEVKADPYAMTIIDDVAFREEGRVTNLAPNSGFEDITDMNYSSGGIISRQSMKYGYMETRAKGAPALPGACSAIWLLGRTEEWGTEIDVLEIGQNQVVNELDFADHTFKTPLSVQVPQQDKNPHGSVGIWGNRNTFNPSEDYHTYGLEWGPGYQNFYVDGDLRGRFYSGSAGPVQSDTVWQQISSEHAANMDAIPQNLLLSLGLRPPYRDGNNESLRTVFDVDYVRVWRSNNETAVGPIKEVNTKEGNLVVPYGTTREELEARLGDSVPVMLNQASSLADQRDIAVEWDTDGFDGTAEGTIYTLDGQLVNLPDGVTNPNDVTAKLNVYIQAKPYRIDREELQKLVDRVYHEKEYKAGSWQNYLLKKEEAQAVLDRADAGEQDIIEAYQALKTAIQDLEPLPDLAGLVMQEYVSWNYTPQSWWVYSQALESAKKVLADPEAASEEIEAAYGRLKDAIDALEELPVGENLLLGKEPSSNTAITHNRQAATDGFVDTSTGWGPSTDKNVYTSVNAGTENGSLNDNGYSTWPGAYLQYDFGSEKPVKRVEINRSWYLTDLKSLTWKDCMVQLSTSPNFTDDTTTTIFGKADIVMGSDTDISGNERKAPQIISLNKPVTARYLRVYGKGHLGGWGGYSARMSYSEIQAFEAMEADSYGITGRVTGKDGEGVKDVTVNLYKGSDTTTAAPDKTTKTDEEGEYGFWDLPDGGYRVEVPEVDGYKPDVKTIEISGGNVRDINFQLEEKDGWKIKIKSMPVKTEYRTGQQLDLTGLVVSLYNNDVEERQLEADEYTVSKLDSSESGAKEITVTYTDRSGQEPVEYKTVFTVTVSEESYGITGHVTGEDGEGVENVTVNLYEGSDITTADLAGTIKTDGEGAYGFNDLSKGTYSVELPAIDGYKQQDAKIIEISGGNVENVDFQLEKKEDEQTDGKIKIKSMPVKTEYRTGQQLDLTGLKVSFYKNGVEERQLEADEYKVSKLDSSKPGKQKITVTYTDRSGSEPVTYKAAFTVTVYEEKLNQSIKVVKKPDRLIYSIGDEVNPEGMEVRGFNLSDEKVIVLNEDDYRLEFDTSKTGTTTVNVVYTVENGETPATELKDYFDIRVFDLDESRFVVEQIKVAQKPYKLTYGPEEDFDPEGMVVEKTVKVLASSSNAVYTEQVSLEELELEVQDFSKTGNRKVKVLYYGEGKDGEEHVFSASFQITVSKAKEKLIAGAVSAVQQRLEKALEYKEYLMDSEKYAAFNQAVEEVGECLEAYGEDGKISEKSYSKLQFLERLLTEEYPDITVVTDPDGMFKKVKAQGLIFSGNLNSDHPQQIRLRIKKTTADEALSEFTEELGSVLAMDISLTADGEETQPALPIRLSMKIPEGLSKEDLVIYQYHDGEWSVITPVISGNQMSFLITNLSLFVAGNKKSVITRPNTSGGGSSNSNREPVNTIPGTWKKDDTGWWYQKNSGGYITSSWAQIDGIWYYFDEIGYMKTGWIFVNDMWYFMKPDGSMASSCWINWEGKWYYLGWNGAMAVNTLTPDGYVVDGNGAWIQ